MLRKRFSGVPSYCGLRGSILAIGILIAATSCESSSSKKSADFPDETADNQLTSWSGSSVPAASATSDEAKRGTFDEQQAQIVLARAAKNAHQCVEIVAKDQPHGDATVTVTFASKGRSTKATINEPYAGAPIGNCATRAFVDIIIPPFEGADVDKTYTVDLKPGAPKSEGKKKTGAGKGE
jgi:hypothetical protein